MGSAKHVRNQSSLSLEGLVSRPSACSWCFLRRRSNASFWPTASSPDWIPEWYIRRSESTSSIDCVRTSASSLILAVASLIYKKKGELFYQNSVEKNGIYTSSSVSCRPSCSTRDLTAFQPVRRWLKSYNESDFSIYHFRDEEEMQYPMDT